MNASIQNLTMFQQLNIFNIVSSTAQTTFDIVAITTRNEIIKSRLKSTKQSKTSNFY